MDKENDAPPTVGKLTVEEIRARVMKIRPSVASLSHDKCSNSSAVSSPAHDGIVPRRKPTNALPSTGPRMTNRESLANNAVTPSQAGGAATNAVATSELAHLTDEILVYCHLLDSSRKRVMDDCSELRQTIKELEKLLESARQREVNHLSYVEQQREAIVMFEKRYFSLKSRARGLIREGQEDREKLRTELDDLKAKTADLETKLYSAQTLSEDQAKELERYREQTKNTPSEKALQDMRLTILKLTDENGRLATERASLIDELKTHKKRAPSGGAGNSAQECSKREEELEMTVRQANAEISELKAALDATRASEDELKAYVSVLLDEVDKAKAAEAQ